MIKFKSVKSQNFNSVGTKPIIIKIDADPITLIRGKNGSGKSSFLDALSFCLYGRAFRNINKDQLINSINKKDCLVEVEFDIGSREYRVVRGMRPTVFEIYENGSLIKPEAGSRDYQEFLEKKILRINHKSFCQIVAIGSATFVPFMKLGPGTRREIIEDLLDLQVFSQMNRLLKQRIDENRDAIADIKYQVDLIQEKITLQKNYIQQTKNKVHADRKDTEQRIEDSKKQILEHHLKIQNLTLEIEKIQETISDFKKISSRKSQYLGVEGQLKERTIKIKKELNFFSTNDHCPTCKQSIDEHFKCTTIDQKNKRLEEVKNASDQLSGELKKTNDRLKEISVQQDKISSLQSSISRENSSISGLNKYISELQKELNSENTFSFTFEEEENKLTSYYEDRETLERRREELINQKATYDVASVLLKDGGIKSKIIKQYIPVINAAINKYLSILDLNVQFEIDETFKETIKSRFREEFSYESFSEGERTRIDLAVTFAWRYIAKLRNSSSTNLLILDEVADGGLDGDGIDDMIKILNTMQDTHIFVISHREGMGDKIEASLKFEKIKGFTHIVED